MQPPFYIPAFADFFMPAKIVRLSDFEYRGLTRFAGTLQQRLGRPVSLSEALGYLVAKAESRTPDYMRLMRQRKKGTRTRKGI